MVIHSRKKNAAKIQDAIRQVLFGEWDPIGVNDISNAVDEYDALVTKTPYFQKNA